MMPARAEDRLGQEGREIAGRLPVHQREGVVQLGLPVQSPVLREGRAVGVRRRDREGSGRRRTVALAAGAVGRRGGAGRHAVPRLGEAHHLPAAGGELGHPQGRLVGLRARGEQQGPFEVARSQPGQLRGEIDDGAAQHAAEQVIEVPDVMGRHRGDLGVAVTQDGAHLTGGEVEDLPAIGVDDEAALGPFDDHGREGAAVPHEVAARAGPELRVGVARHGRMLLPGSAGSS